MHDSSVRVYGMIMRGTLGDCLYRNAAEKNNKHRINAKKRSETPTSQFEVLSYDQSNPNLHVIGDGGSRSCLVISRDRVRLTSGLYFSLNLLLWTLFSAMQIEKCMQRPDFACYPFVLKCFCIKRPYRSSFALGMKKQWNIYYLINFNRRS